MRTLSVQYSSQPISLEETKIELHNLHSKIKEITNVLGYQAENISYSPDDPDEVFF